MYAYALRFAGGIQVTPYWQPESVEQFGGNADVLVPSRTPKEERYKITIAGIPVIDHAWKYVLANALMTTHSCEDVRYKDKRFPYKNREERHEMQAELKQDAHVINWDAHSIAAWYAVLDHFLNEEQNVVPLAMSQIAIPSQKMAEIADFYRYHAVIYTKNWPGQKRAKEETLDDAEREIALWTELAHSTHHALLFSDSRRDGNLRDYHWHNMPDERSRR